MDHLDELVVVLRVPKVLDLLAALAPIEVTLQIVPHKLLYDLADGHRELAAQSVNLVEVVFCDHVLAHGQGAVIDQRLGVAATVQDASAERAKLRVEGADGVVEVAACKDASHDHFALAEVRLDAVLLHDFVVCCHQPEPRAAGAG